MFIAESMTAERAGLAHEIRLLLAAFIVAGLIHFLHILQHLIKLLSIVFQLLACYFVDNFRNCFVFV